MDTPETLAAKLLEAGAAAIVTSRAIVQKGALNIKNSAKANVERTAPVHNAHAARTIGYETKIRPTTVEGEIGYDLEKGKAANIAWLLEYGGGKDHSPAHHDVRLAGEAEEPGFVHALEAMSRKLL